MMFSDGSKDFFFLLLFLRQNNLWCDQKNSGLGIRRWENHVVNSLHIENLKHIIETALLLKIQK